MEYKILIIKNRYNRKVDFSDGIKHIEKNTPLKLVFDEIETDIDLVFGEVGNGTFKGGVPTNYHDFKKFVPENKYNAVCLLYGNDCPFIRVSITYYSPLYQNTEFMAVVNDRDRGTTFNHELFHAFFYQANRNGAGIIDVMDTYENDKSLNASVSNRTKSLIALAPHWEKVIKLYQPSNQNSNKNYMWKYFKPSEKTGSQGTIAQLNKTLVDMLDVARGHAGIAFAITSGFRTPEHNKAVGGVADSAHLKGLAVDIRCRNSAELFAIVNGLLKAGFNRIGLGSGFVHADIDTTKPKNVIFNYDN